MPVGRVYRAKSTLRCLRLQLSFSGANNRVHEREGLIVIRALVDPLSEELIDPVMNGNRLVDLGTAPLGVGPDIDQVLGLGVNRHPLSDGSHPSILLG